MINMNLYLHFDGTCVEALKYYEKALGGKILSMVKNSDAPATMKMPPGSADRIMHGRLQLNGHTLFASDTMPGQPYPGMKGFTISLTYPTTAEAQRIFTALADGGSVVMPMTKTFWAESFGMCSDRFGVPWMVMGGLLS